ncbi:MAG: hypothetical protein ACRDNZ_03075 [Streptosporangiaceae bacterium]
MSHSPVSPEDVRAAAETYQELGPEYHDVVVASFLAKVDHEVAARVEARVAGMTAAAKPKRKRWGAMLARRRVLRDLTAASVGAMAVLAAVTVTHGPLAATAAARGAAGHTIRYMDVSGAYIIVDSHGVLVAGHARGHGIISIDQVTREPNNIQVVKPPK